MKKLFALTALLATTSFSFAQETFTSKQEAINYLKEAFSTYFIKTAVYKTNDAENIPFIYDFEIRERQIIIWRASGKTASGINKDKDVWQNMPYEKIEEMLRVDKSDVFKDLTGLACKPPFGGAFLTGSGEEISDRYTGTYSTTVIFPFTLLKNKKDREQIMQSLFNAINLLSNEIKKETKIADREATDTKQKLIAQETIDNKIAYTYLPAYKIFTADDSITSFPEYIDKNRTFKNKPTLIVTWSNVYCRPCIKIIDALLNNGVALKYNIVLVNKEDDKTDFSALKTKISNHTPNYIKDAILLFDKNNQLEPIDKNGTPFFIWLDKNLKIVRSYAGYDISVTTINNILAEIE